MRLSRVRPILVALLLSFGLASGCDNAAGPSPRANTRIVAFGDSLTVGIGTTEGNGFVPLLSQRLSINIINAGRAGDTTGTALPRLDDDVLDRDPDIVIVLLGGNDLLQGVPVQQRVNNITTIVERIRASGADVLLLGLGAGMLDAFEGALPGLATRTGSTLIPGILEGIFGVPSLMADAIHPNNAGHKIMADRIEPALRALVNAPALSALQSN